MPSLIRQQGISLIEILVALAIGILLLGAASSVGLTSLSSSKDGIINSNAQQQLQIVMNSLTRELRRAGYSKSEETIQTATGFRNIAFLDGNKCAVFRYDRLPESASALSPPGDGTLVNAEVRGIRLSGNQIKIITAATSTSMPTSCDDAGTWEDLSNSSLKITALTLTPLKVMLIDGSEVIDQVTVSITAESKSTPVQNLSISEVVQLRNRPFAN
ncbi:prepilin-type N-terminal cleavage/methylation domain-containing protein [Chitinibacter sp. SCUT-21]|uniref:PilW family protein n=1 Tax=Chitinibacter sp. SCUT-21 TaxID=2970891 RepID=UPI0035A7113B